MTKKIKQIRRISTWTWSSHSYLMGAAGTDTAELEVYKWNDTSYKLKTSSRLTTLAWGGQDVIAGGTDKGDLELYNVSHNQEDCLLFRTNMMVKALDFSRIESNYLASVGNQNDFYIWDLNQPSTMMTGLKSTKMMDISNVSWNSQVKHIIASSAKNGYTVVWDLRTKREILSLYAPESNISSIAWHPNMGTQIMTASRNNQNPVLSLWDLRNSHSPEKVLAGHSQGILDISWCSQDPDRLVSCDLGGHVHCYDPIQGEFISELVHLVHPIPQIDFCPSNPDIFAARSTSLNIYTLQPTSIKRPSSMIKRPSSVCFGFGNKLVRCNGTKVHISTVPVSADLVERVKQVESMSVDELIEENKDERDWDIIKILNSDNAREDLIQYIQQNYPTTNITTGPPTETRIKHDPAVDLVITQHVAIGDFESAVNVCIENDRYADALMFSMCGENSLLQQTQQLYLERQQTQYKYLSILKGIMNQDLDSVLKEANIERDWPTLFVILCTFATADDFESLCDVLGDQLKDKQHALLFYLASGNLGQVASIWLDSGMELQPLMERLSVFIQVEKQNELGGVYYDYAEMLVQNGLLDMALKYIQLVPNQDLKQRILHDRIYHACTTKTKPIPEFPFQKRRMSAPSSNATLTYYSAHQQPF